MALLELIKNPVAARGSRHQHTNSIEATLFVNVGLLLQPPNVFPVCGVVGHAAGTCVLS